MLIAPFKSPSTEKVFAFHSRITALLKPFFFKNGIKFLSDFRSVFAEAEDTKTLSDLTPESINESQKIVLSTPRPRSTVWISDANSLLFSSIMIIKNPPQRKSKANANHFKVIFFNNLK